MSATMMKLDLRAPHQKYYNRAGEQVAGVTTKLGVYSKDALLGWYAAEEREGILRTYRSMFGGGEPVAMMSLSDMLPQKDGKPIWFATMKRDSAADLGTIAHGHIQAQNLGTILDPYGLDQKMYDDAMIPAGRFFEWVREKKATLVRCEFQMVSERWQTGGTGDNWFRMPDGSLEYWDTKTSKPWAHGHPYDEQIAQSAAYADFYEELTGEHVAAIRIARVGKTVEDEGDLYPVTDAMRACGMTLFQNAVSAYNAKKMLGKMFR